MEVLKMYSIKTFDKMYFINQSNTNNYVIIKFENFTSSSPNKDQVNFIYGSNTLRRRSYIILIRYLFYCTNIITDLITKYCKTQIIQHK